MNLLDFFKAIVNLNPQLKGDLNVQKVKYYPF